MDSTKNSEGSFQYRHIGPRAEDLQAMLDSIGVDSLDRLMDETIPGNIRRKTPLNLPDAMTEQSYLEMLEHIGKKNRVLRSYIGLGFHDCIIPPVIQRNILENPGWYTQYTPYQAEISQGRLEALLNFQTMIIDLTKMDVANASLLDEGTAAAEAMTMTHGVVSRQLPEANRFFVSDTCLPQTVDVLKARALPLGITLVVGNHAATPIDSSFFGGIVQYPAQDGAIHDYRPFVERVHSAGGLVVVAADLLSLALLTPPGEFGADIVVGNSQRFGVPLGFGGPHAAFFATRNDYVRGMPGRIIGVSVDADGNRAYRMALQTREQHIRREKATSNICTAQALLAIMAGMYAVYHGPGGITRIAQHVHRMATMLAQELTSLGYSQLQSVYFDTVKLKVDNATKIRTLAEASEINLRTIDEKTIGISVNETTQPGDIQNIASVFARAAGKELRKRTVDFDSNGSTFPTPFHRTSSFLTHPVFKMYHSETEMMRYIKSLENRDLSLMHSMIPLGSCTMKLNAASELMPISWHEFSRIHPFVPADQVPGYHQIFKELEAQLCEITGFSAASLQPNSGAQGEYTGLLVIKAYHKDHGNGHRNVALLPTSAHGTNPASAVMAGCTVVLVKCDDRGNIDVDDLRAKAGEHRENLAALMVTYPSTHGVFEEDISEICRIVHDNGGLVYMDGANLNAQVGLTSPATIGADVCHINLHKTFAIPHGGGGPGMGPICTTKDLAPYLPGHPLVKTGGSKAIPAVASTPWGSSSILTISYGYIRMLGAAGVTEATRYAILNANYLKSRLEAHYPVLYKGKSGHVAHEFILDLRPLKQETGVEADDVAKRLMDYGFHAPTVSFPVAGTLMIEPTESESKAELDRLADALIAIRSEIKEIADGKADPHDNVLKNAPHTAHAALSEEWNHPYTRYKAVYPLPHLRDRKFWPAVGRINNSFGDRNLMCSCPPIECYEEQEA